MLISLAVVRWHGWHFVKDMTKVVSDFGLDGYLLFEEVEIIHTSVSLNLSDWLCQWIELFHVGDQNLVNLLSQFFFCFSADRINYILGKGFIHIFFVVFNSNLSRWQMFDVLEHINGVRQRRKVVVHLVQTCFVTDDFLEENVTQSPLPVNKSATCRTSYVYFPVTDESKTPIQIINLLQLYLVKNIFSNEVKAMTNNCLTQSVVSTLITL